MKVKEMKKLSEQLELYKKENVCKCASSQCNGCTFNVEKGTGCALNLLINTLEHNLSIFKHEASIQFKQIYNFEQ